jgi:hypothetical protein
MSQPANKDCVRRHFEELWNHGTVEKIGEFFSPEFSNFGVKGHDFSHAVKRPRTAGLWPLRRVFRNFRIGGDPTATQSGSVIRLHRWKNELLIMLRRRLQRFRRIANFQNQ